MKRNIMIAEIERNGRTLFEGSCECGYSVRGRKELDVFTELAKHYVRHAYQDAFEAYTQELQSGVLKCRGCRTNREIEPGYRSCSKCRERSKQYADAHRAEINEHKRKLRSYGLEVRGSYYRKPPIP